MFCVNGNYKLIKVWGDAQILAINIELEIWKECTQKVAR